MIVLKGLQGPVTVKGQQYGTAVMQPWDKTLTDQTRRRPHIRAKRVGQQRQSRHSRADRRAYAKNSPVIAESFTEHDILAAPDEDLPGGPATAGGAPPKPGEAAKPAASPKP